MTYKYNPLHSEFIYGSVLLKVHECVGPDASCEGCWFNGRHHKTKRNFNGSCFLHAHACTPANRKDRKQVVFKFVKNV